MASTDAEINARERQAQQDAQVIDTPAKRRKRRTYKEVLASLEARIADLRAKDRKARAASRKLKAERTLRRQAAMGSAILDAAREGSRGALALVAHVLRTCSDQQRAWINPLVTELEQALPTPIGAGWWESVSRQDAPSSAEAI
jgi:hypothetical protein